MEELSPGTIAALGGLAGGAALGFAARWGRFCTLGAIEDATLGNSRGRLAAWGVAIAVAIAGTFGLDFIRIGDGNPSRAGAWEGDNLIASADFVPEPGVTALLAVGVGLLALLRRRRG